MPSVRSVRLWGSLAALSLVVAAVALTATREEAEPHVAPRQGLESLLRQVTQLIHEAHGKRDRARLDRAERLLKSALKGQEANRDQLLAALGHVHLARGTFDNKATAVQQRRVPASARALFAQALRLNPNNASALHGMAKHHEFREDFGAALKLDDQILAFAPHDLKALKHRGRCLLMLKRYVRAEEALLAALEQARAVDDKTAVIFAQELLGKAYLKQRKYARAEKVLLAAVEGAEATRVAACPYAALGELYSATGREVQAVKTSMRAADMEAAVPQMQYLTARKCFVAGHYKEARRYIDRALKLEPGQKAYLELRGEILEVAAPGPAARELATALTTFDDQQYRRAKIHVDRALAAGAGSRARVVKGFLLLLQKKYPAARQHFQAAGEADPGDAGARVGLGHLAIVRKQYAAARRLLEPEVTAGDVAFGAGRKVSLEGYGWLTYRMAAQGMGWLLANQNRHVEANKQFDRVLTRDDADVFALLGKGNSLNAQGKLDGAQRHLQKVLENDPYNQYALAELALVQLNRGKLGDAEELFKAALRQSGSARYTCPHEGLGMVYMRAGKLKLAKASFRKAIEINPNIEFKKFNGLARIFIREGKHDEARKLLRQSIKNYPHDDEARKLLATIRRR